MELSEHKVAIHSKKQLKIYDKKFLIYSLLNFRRLIKAHHVICMTVRKKTNRIFEVLTIEAAN